LATSKVFYWIGLRVRKPEGDTLKLKGPYNTQVGRDKMVFNDSGLWDAAGIESVIFDTVGRNKGVAEQTAIDELNGVVPGSTTAIQQVNNNAQKVPDYSQVSDYSLGEIQGTAQSIPQNITQNVPENVPQSTPPRTLEQIARSRGVSKIIG